MAKKNKKDSSDHVGFRAKSVEQKKEFYDRSNILSDSKGISKADIFEAGLLAYEDGVSEEQLQRKKNRLINIRDSLLEEAVDLNKRIEAYNRQLKNKPNGRHENLDVEDHVLTIEILDKEGNEYKY